MNLKIKARLNIKIPAFAIQKSDSYNLFKKCKFYCKKIIIKKNTEKFYIFKNYKNQGQNFNLKKINK